MNSVPTHGGDGCLPPAGAAGAARHWIVRSVWTLVDQVTFSTSNLLLYVLLARWLAPQAYGAFAIAFAIFLLVGAIHSTILVEPMFVFGPGRYRDDFQGYFRGLLRMHCRISLAVSTAVLAAAAVLLEANRSVALLLLSAAAAIPCVLFSWLVRRAFYVVDAIPRGALCSAIYAGVLVVELGALRVGGVLTPATAFASLALAGLSSGLVSLRLLLEKSETNVATPREILAIHLPYSRWATASTLFMWVPANAIVVALPAFSGLESAAALRAALNVVSPAQTLWTAFGLMLMPALVRAGTREDFRLVRRWVALCLIAGGAAWALLAAYHGQLFHLLYHGKYDTHSRLLVVLGAYPLVVGVEVTLEMLYRSRQQPKRVFAAWLVASALVIPGTLFALKWFDTRAAAAGIIFTYATCAALLCRPLLHRAIRTRVSSGATAT